MITKTIEQKDFDGIKENKETKTEKWNCLDHIIWENVAYLLSIHIGAVYGLYLCFTEAKIMTVLFGLQLNNYFFI